MHPYEWGILGIKALDFYPLFDCADCSHPSMLWWLSARLNLESSIDCWARREKAIQNGVNNAQSQPFIFAFLLK